MACSYPAGTDLDLGYYLRPRSSSDIAGCSWLDSSA